MTGLPALKPAAPSTRHRLRILTLAGLCSLAAALPALTPPNHVIGYRSLSLKDLRRLSALRLPVSLPTGTELWPPLAVAIASSPLD